MAVALFGVAVALRVIAVRRSDKRIMAGAGVALALAIGVVVLARSVVTTTETIKQRTRELIEATAPLDIEALDDIFTPETRLTGPDGSVWFDVDEVFSHLIWADKTYVIGSQKITLMEAYAPQPDHAVSNFELRSVAGVTGTPVRTVWKIIWIREDDGQWRVEVIQWLEFQGRLPTTDLVR